ncbi:MAG: winged helix-turn-helix transcriptional regulator [Cyanobacteria bacterium NC_groundwater_1444_Ag_S-0.65um_54_12]|nr:winged helix-turn-helix transcriptional regulator [Cyanobacteria bacterium NC_groundwater_1444_Ag_S-0.65um_54_12]
MDLLLRDAQKLVERFAELVRAILEREPSNQENAGEIETGAITPAQLAALQYIGRHAPAYVGGLSDGLAISYPAATKTVDRLVNKSLVRRYDDPRDRRLTTLALTPEGSELLDRAKRLRHERLSSVLGRMADGDHKALLRGLRGFLTTAFLIDHELIGQICERCGNECYENCVINQAHLALYGSAIAET